MIISEILYDIHDGYNLSLTPPFLKLLFLNLNYAHKSGFAHVRLVGDNIQRCVPTPEIEDLQHCTNLQVRSFEKRISTDRHT